MHRFIGRRIGARIVLTCLVASCCLFAGILASPGLAASPEENPPADNQVQPESTPGAATEAPPPPDADIKAMPAQVTERPPSPERTAVQEKVRESLANATFAYVPTNMLDPFVPFIHPAEAPQQVVESEEDDSELPPIPKKPMTPLQKMTLVEIERGLKAIIWGGMGRRAVIEDSAGKGYIVTVGTPAGDKNGTITEIFNDRLVIQQEIWDNQSKRIVPRDSIVKLKKESEKQR